MIPYTLVAPVGDLLQAAGLARTFTAEPIKGGGNNRVFRIEANGRVAALKIYFHHAEDGRDRLGTEYAFARFAWDSGLRMLPEPIAANFEHRMALYEFIPGRRLAPKELDAAAVGEALAFFTALNRNRAAARYLGPGSEACFSVAEHLATVDRRISRHRQITGADAEDEAARDFVATRLEPAWRDLRARIAARIGAALEEPLPPELRCISPSDFGFHNAILVDSRLCFIDFEYAGWDDPAKLVGDFFNQVEMPVPSSHLPAFIDAVAAALDDPDGRIARRSKLLLPVYTIKWCCIVLNEFHATGSARRRFAAVGDRDRKAKQVAKAHAAFARLAPLIALSQECSNGLC
ncbi:MAG: phosphotransferase [Stellaceae bacterium]